MTDIERLSYDVVVIGAGGSGLRAAIEARQRGKQTAIISKSLFGKAHTVMAEGGIAAAMGNVNPSDNWQVHFRDTMRGGKLLNNWRMAELHAKEAPDRVWELEAWGALFDRTQDGKISQRNFGGHEYPRLAHVGDRTGLELIRTLQQRVVALQQEDAVAHGDPEAMIKVFAEPTITELVKDADGRIAGAFGYFRDTGKFVVFEAPAVVLATGGIGKSFKVTSNSWEYTGDGHALALLAGANLLNMEFVQFHPTGMVWPLSVRGCWSPSRSAATAACCATPRASGSCSTTCRTCSGRSTRRPRKRPTAGTPTRSTTAARRSCCPATRSPGPSTARSRPAAAPRTAACSSTSSIAAPAEDILRELPSMYHQFKELADVDITKEPMEVGPTCHYVMGGVEVDPDTAATAVPGPVRGGRGRGRHARRRTGSAATRCPTCWCSAAGPASARRTTWMGCRRAARRPRTPTWRPPPPRRLAPFERAGGENPYAVHADLQQTMNDLVGHHPHGSRR